MVGYRDILLESQGLWFGGSGHRIVHFCGSVRTKCRARGSFLFILFCNPDISKYNQIYSDVMLMQVCATMHNIPSCFKDKIRSGTFWNDSEYLFCLVVEVMHERFSMHCFLQHIPKKQKVLFSLSVKKIKLKLTP